MNSFDPGNRLIVALDVPDGATAAALVQRLDGAASWLKVGLELFIAEGPALVRKMALSGNRIMLDLKLHDIPATVARATAQAAMLGAGLLTVHAGGGPAMLEAAASAAGPTMRILAVTVLTSMDASDLRAVGIAGSAEQVVVERARLAVQSGCHGVVASPEEAPRIRDVVPAGFLVVTPGVRPLGASADDQKRVCTPGQARRAGADMVVVGRPIRDAADPGAAARAIAGELG